MFDTTFENSSTTTIEIEDSLLTNVSFKHSEIKLGFFSNIKYENVNFDSSIINNSDLNTVDFFEGKAKSTSIKINIKHEFRKV